MILSISKLKCTLSHKNVRTEIHGDENPVAWDLKFTAKCSNKVLDFIDPEIRQMLYFAQIDGEGQKSMELEEGFTPNLRAPMLMGQKKPYMIDYKGAGYRVILHSQMDNEDLDILLSECKLTDINFKAMDGGTIELSFKIQLYPNDQSYDGDIEEFLGEVIDVSLEPPRAEGSEFGSLAVD